MRIFITILTLLFLVAPAHSQVASFDGGSIYDLDPKANQSTGNRILEQMVQNDDMQAVADIAPSDIIRQLSRPVGRLTLEIGGGIFGGRKKGAYCTASLIDKNLLITNYHCVPGHGKVKKALLTMGYLEPRKRTGVAQYPVDIKPIEASKELDYAILRVSGNPGDEWGTIKLSTHTPGGRNTLFIIHHPGGFPQYISRGRCQTSSPAIDGNDLLHVCDTLPGSSGAPIFDNNSRKVIGLHFSAVALKHLNAGKRIASIAKHSPLIARLVHRAQSGGTKPRPLVRDGAALAWGTVQNSKSCAVLASFIKRHKGSEYADYASARRDELGCGKKKKLAVGIYPKQPDPSQDRLPYEPEVVHIPAGTFQMGCVSGKSCSSDEKPVHRVTVGSFYLSKYETTVGEYMACVKAGKCRAPKWKEKGSEYNAKTGSDDHYKKLGRALRGDRYPIVGVSWNDAIAYAKWLSRKTGQVWRLPTEAEWEYAARAGSKKKYIWGNSIGRNKANCGSDCEDKWKYTSPVGSFRNSANRFGVYDMHGNVSEWVNDWYGEKYYSSSPANNPKGPRNGSLRVIRGGGWGNSASSLRSAYRFNLSPGLRDDALGFRLLRQPS